MLCMLLLLDLTRGDPLRDRLLSGNRSGLNILLLAISGVMSTQILLHILTLRSIWVLILCCRRLLLLHRARRDIQNGRCTGGGMGQGLEMRVRMKRVRKWIVCPGKTELRVAISLDPRFIGYWRWTLRPYVELFIIKHR